MSFQAKRELLAQTAGRYQAAGRAEKSIILSEIAAATGYTRKYAIRVPRQPPPVAAAITRPQAPCYGPQVQAALRVAWEAANSICGKRLVPFLPELVPALERHGHLPLTGEVRAQLLALSPVTADRLLVGARRAAGPHWHVVCAPCPVSADDETPIFPGAGAVVRHPDRSRLPLARRVFLRSAVVCPILVACGD